MVCLAAQGSSNSERGMPFSCLGKDIETFKAWQYSVDMEICNIQFQLAQLTKAISQLKTPPPCRCCLPPPCEAHC